MEGPRRPVMPPGWLFCAFLALWSNLAKPFSAWQPHQAAQHALPVRGNVPGCPPGVSNLHTTPAE